VYTAIERYIVVMRFTDPTRLAKRQIEIDRQRLSRFPDLLPHKTARMLSSPLAFLRGAAPLFYETLAESPDLAAGPTDEGWIIGDAHLENFGAFQTLVHDASGGPARKTATFDVNDFDEAVRGRWRWDVLRLATSVILASRELGVNGTTSIAMCVTLLAGYVSAACGAASVPPRPQPVLKLVERMAKRTKRDLLEARTSLVAGKRLFTRGARYRDLPVEVLAHLPQALARYVAQLPDVERPAPQRLEIIDAAHRIAGTGSLGALRIAVLAHGKGAPDGHWLFDMKEQLAPAALPLLSEAPVSLAEGRATACRACLDGPPRMLGTTELSGTSLLVRRLAPQEDKLNLQQLQKAELEPLAQYLGAVLGRAHYRGAGSRRRPEWSLSDRAAVLEHAVALAGLHEATYLAYCALSTTQEAPTEHPPDASRAAHPLQ
jgi:uncharacterized protein (DUF2252 family)